MTPAEIPIADDVIRLEDPGAETDGEIARAPRKDSTVWAPPRGTSSGPG